MKNTKEAILAAVVIGKFIQERLKDGAQLEDAMALGQVLLLDGEFKRIVTEGYKDADQIDDEFKDFNMAKAMELAQVIPEIVRLIQKKAA